MVDFFGARAWQDLVPDLDNHFLVEGAGDPTDEGDVLEQRLRHRGRDAGRHARRRLRPDVADGRASTRRRLPAGVHGPLVRSRPTARTVARRRSPYTTPGKNAAGDEDWVLVLEQPS